MKVGNIPWSRRKFLLATAALLIAGCSKSEDDSSIGGVRKSATAPDWLSPLTGDRAAAARLGRSYLDLHSRYRAPDVLLTDIRRTLAVRNPEISELRDTQRVVAIFQQLVREEYIEAEVLSLTGWILSQTEARLYALAALEAD